MNKNNWTYKKLGEIASFASGSRPSGGVRLITQGVLSLGGEHIGRNGYIDLSTPKYVSEQYFKDNTKGHLKNGDILLCKDGALSGKVALVREELQNNSAMVNEHVFIIRTDSLYQPYLFNFLFSPIGQSELKARITGAAQGGINGTNLKTILIPIPPLAEQERIVAELDLLSSIIEKKKAQLKELDQLAQSIFYDMFGDPITNEKGWEVKKLGEVCRAIGDGLHGTPQYDANGTIAFINGNNLIDGKITITPKTLYVNNSEAQKIHIELDTNTILLSINGTLGKTAVYNNEKVVLGKSACYCKLTNKLNVVFVLSLMNTNTFKCFLESNSSKSTIKNVGLKAIRNYKVILPPLPLQQEFASKVEAIERQKSLIQQSIDEVQTLFDSRMDYWFG